MADFNEYLPKLLRFEGGWVDDPADPGGATNKGVTLQTFQRFAQPLLGVDPVIENLRRLTDEQAGRIYRQAYWDKLGGDAIALQPLAEIYIDFFVNAGAYGVRHMQRCLNACGVQPPLAVDGLPGPQTLDAVLAADALDLYRRYRTARIGYYHALADKRPSLQRFLKGWLQRVAAFPEL